MAFIKYIKLNFSSMLNDHLLIFLLIIISAALTSLCMFFSYGLFINTQEVLGKMENDRFVYDYSIPYKDGLQSSIVSLENELGDELDHIDLFLRVKDKNDVEHSCVAYSSFDSSEGSSYICKLSDSLAYLLEDNDIVFDGVKYKAILVEHQKLYSDVALPLNSITDKSIGSEIMIYIKSQPTAAGTEEMNKLMTELFSAKSISVPQARSLMDKQMNNSFYAYSFIIVIIVVLNLSMYFRYIINIRRKQIMVLFICGALKIQIGAVYLIEAILELLIGYAIAFVLFSRYLLNILVQYYPNFKDYYSPKLYLSTLLIYITGSVLILILSIFPYVNKLLISKKGGITNA